VAPGGFHHPRAGLLAGPDELHHVAVGVLHEHLAQAGGAREDVAADEAELADAVGRGVAVVGPQREVRVAGLDLLALDGGPYELVVQDDVQLQVAAQAVPDAREVERRPCDLLKTQRVGVELPGLGDVGDGDADVGELLEEAHASLPWSGIIHRSGVHSPCNGCAPPGTLISVARPP
jgi:hypothetical protein